MTGRPFKRILHANDGSKGAFKALTMALDIAAQNHAELHMVLVEELSPFPETIDEVNVEKGAADRRFRNVLKRAEKMAEEEGVKIKSHVLTGHPVTSIVELARKLDADLLVIGATGHYALYERMIGSRADRLIHLAHCPILVAK
jgi:nucleotide-binding universal stress UspA family protein